MTELVYVDTSVAIALSFREAGWEDLRSAGRTAREAGCTFVSCELLRTEVRRVHFRNQQSFRGADESVRWINLIETTNAMVRDAGTISAHVKTLGAIHLAAAQSLRDERTPLTLWTLDDQMRRGAEHLGLDLLGSR